MLLLISPFTFYYFYNLEIRTIICKWRLIHLKLFYCRLYFTAFTTVSMPLIVNAKMMIERNTLLKCIKTCEITSASVPNNCSIPSKNPLFIILSFNSQMLVNAPSIILVIMVTSITLLPDYLTSQSAPCIIPINTHILFISPSSLNKTTYSQYCSVRKTILIYNYLI